MKSSEKFAKILELLLLLGNYMNSGSNNAGAYGFEISFLTKVTTTFIHIPQNKDKINGSFAKSDSGSKNAGVCSQK